MKNKIRAILTSKNWLLLSLAIAFLCYYAFNRGAAKTWVDICGFFVFLRIILKQYNWHDLFTGPLLFSIATFLLLALISLFVGGDFSHGRNITILTLIIGIHCLFTNEPGHDKYYYFFFLLLLITAGWHAFSFYSSPTQYVEQTNRNILASFLIMVIPFLLFYLITLGNQKKHFLTALATLLTVASLDILLKAQSRPALLGLLAGFFCCIIFFLKGKRKAYWFIAFAGGILFVTTTNYAGMFAKLKALAINIALEERVFIWKDALKMIGESNIIKILVGHGIGSFRDGFPDFSSVAGFCHFVFPHNFILELLYESGFLGLTLITTLFVFIAYMLIQVIRTTPSYRVNVFSKCLFAYYLAWVFHCGLTVPFFSKYTLYPLGFTLGAVNILYLTTIKPIPEKTSRKRPQAEAR